MRKISRGAKALIGVLVLWVLFVLMAIFFPEERPYGPSVPPNLECFQVVGKDSPAGTLAIQVYWCRDLTNNELCYWWNPVQGLAETQCNRTIFKEND